VPGKIAVKFYALLRQRLGMSAIEVDADGLTILELLRRVEKQAGRSFLDDLLDPEHLLLAGTIILVNGENVRLKQGLGTPLRGGDTVDLFSPAGGG
jgi:MoaD family protein